MAFAFAGGVLLFSLVLSPRLGAPAWLINAVAWVLFVGFTAYFLSELVALAHGKEFGLWAPFPSQVPRDATLAFLDS